MGIDPHRIHYLRHFIETNAISFADIAIASDIYGEKDFFAGNSAYLDFVLPQGWSEIVV